MAGAAFGTRLRQLRKQAGMSLTELRVALAEHGLDVSKQKLSAWELARYRPRHRAEVEALDAILSGAGDLVDLAGFVAPDSLLEHRLRELDERVDAQITRLEERIDHLTALVVAELEATRDGPATAQD